MKKLRKKITMIVEKTDTGFSAFSETSPIFTSGRTFTELMNKAIEASSLYFEDENLTVTQDNLKFIISLHS